MSDLPPVMRHRWSLLAAAAAAVASLAVAARTLSALTARVVDQDQAIYWYAVEEFSRFRFREPFFYGQAYHHLGEALLAVPVVALGVPPWIAVPAASVAVGLATWAILAWMAWRRGALGLGVALLGVPAVMPFGYQVLLSRMFGGGLLLVAVALLVAVSSSSPRRWTTAGFLAALGVALVPNAGLFALVALAWLATTTLRSRKDWALLGGGIAAGVALHGVGRLFYVANPGWVVHEAPTVEFGLDLLAEGLVNLPRHLGRVTPGVLIHPATLLGAMLIIGAIALRRRTWEVLAPAIATVLLTVGSLAVAKAHVASPSAFFAYERFFLGLPLAAGVVALAVVGAWSRSRPAWPWSPLACAACVLALAAPRQVMLEQGVARERAMRPAVGDGNALVAVLDLVDVEEVRRDCAGIEASAARLGAELVVFSTSNTRAYACGALSYGKVVTLFLGQERRTWILLEEASKTREISVLADVWPSRACRSIERIPGYSCTPGGSSWVVLHHKAATVLQLAHDLDLGVRPF